MTVNFPDVLTKISTFIFDVDGVLTDGSVVLFPDGEQVRTMNIKDGFALQLAVKKGFKVAIISGGKSEAVKKRLQGLGIFDIYMGQSDKLDAYLELLSIYNLQPDEIAYMGDDLPDYQILEKVALKSCPANAASEILGIANYVSPYHGGDGCVRDIIEKVMRAQDKWFNPDIKDIAHQW
jgi:3-deoxy-D-manno-octulosonate 8-phosphate phosphatase (KDO 8-P phosphatase)